MDLTVIIFAAACLALMCAGLAVCCVLVSGRRERREEPQRDLTGPDAGAEGQHSGPEE